MARKRRTIYLGDQRWRIARGKRLRDKTMGVCNYETRTIHLCRSLAGIDLLDTLIHELIHARWPDLSEEAVEEFASELAGIIHAEGFVHADEHD